MPLLLGDKRAAMTAVAVADDDKDETDDGGDADTTIVPLSSFSSSSRSFLADVFSFSFIFLLRR